MWGWTGIYQQAPDWNFENPTYVGMDRATKTRLPTCWPKTPRMWGWTVTLPDFEAMADENPTYVGMDRLVKAPVLHKECKPHVCGDGPILDEQEVRLTQ